jgi:putative hydrolase of the HAD superfamily
MIKLLLFDLDNTLFDTYGQLGVKVLDDIIRRMKKAGLTDAQEKEIRGKYSYTSFRIIAKELRLSGELASIGMEAYKFMDLSHIKPFPDIDCLKRLKQKKVLVTSGSNDVQLKKVKILKIKDLFDEVIVDEANNLENKQRIFAELMKKHELRAEEVLVIGDNNESEIGAGNKLGMITVQILRRENMRRASSDYHIKSLQELDEIIAEMK